MFTQAALSILIRMAVESVKLERCVYVASEIIKDYQSDLELLVHIINENNIELDEFDYIVLNNVRKKSHD